MRPATARGLFALPGLPQSWLGLLTHFAKNAALTMLLLLSIYSLLSIWHLGLGASLRYPYLDDSAEDGDQSDDQPGSLAAAVAFAVQDGSLQTPKGMGSGGLKQERILPGASEKRADAKTCSAGDIFRAWTEEYDVEAKANRTLAVPIIASDGPSAASPQNSICALAPAAPHLRCCDDIDALRRVAEKRNPDGSLPAWAKMELAEDPQDEPHPSPPWIQGGPRDNLPLTHRAQTDIWAHQFPSDECAGPNTRFLISWWDDPRHGIGSHIHLMSGILELALKHNRVFTYLNYSYHRAQHEGCRGKHYSSFECYFALPTSQACNDKAMEGFLSGAKEWRSSVFYDVVKIQRTSWRLFDIMDSDQPFVVVSPKIFQVYSGSPIPMPKPWGTPWKAQNISIVLGDAENPQIDSDTRLEKNWVRAQFTRFLLRWPSPYLCHLVNFAQHQTFGIRAAQSLAHAPATPDPHNTKACPNLHGSGLDGTSSAGPASVAQAGAELRRLQGLFLPRPIIRVHLRGSDKGAEMKLLSFDAYMGAAEKIQALSLANVSNVWLSSEEQNPFDSLKKFPQWKFYSLQMDRKRQQGEVADQWAFASAHGLRDYVDASFCNLLISAESDGFVLALGSNWDRLVNELRLTGGRLHSPVIALNSETWEL